MIPFSLQRAERPEVSISPIVTIECPAALGKHRIQPCDRGLRGPGTYTGGRPRHSGPGGHAAGAFTSTLGIGN